MMSSCLESCLLNTYWIYLLDNKYGQIGHIKLYTDQMLQTIIKKKLSDKQNNVLKTKLLFTSGDELFKIMSAKNKVMSGRDGQTQYNS